MVPSLQHELAALTMGKSTGLTAWGAREYSAPKQDPTLPPSAPKVPDSAAVEELLPTRFGLEDSKQPCCCPEPEQSQRRAGTCTAAAGVLGTRPGPRSLTLRDQGVCHLLLGAQHQPMKKVPPHLLAHSPGCPNRSPTSAL